VSSVAAARLTAGVPAEPPSWGRCGSAAPAAAATLWRPGDRPTSHSSRSGPTASSCGGQGSLWPPASGVEAPVPGEGGVGCRRAGSRALWLPAGASRDGDSWQTAAGGQAAPGAGAAERGEAAGHHDDEEEGEIPLQEDHVWQEAQSPRGTSVGLRPGPRLEPSARSARTGSELRVAEAESVPSGVPGEGTGRRWARATLHQPLARLRPRLGSVCSLGALARAQRGKRLPRSAPCRAGSGGVHLPRLRMGVWWDGGRTAPGFSPGVSGGGFSTGEQTRGEEESPRRRCQRGEKEKQEGAASVTGPGAARGGWLRPADHRLGVRTPRFAAGTEMRNYNASRP